MKNSNVVQFEGRDENTDLLTQLLQTGARQLLAQAIEAEVSEFLAQFHDRTLESGRAAVVRNGHQPERDIQTGIGPVSVKIPKVRSRDGEPVTFRSALVPPFVRRTKSLEAALPWLYLKGISSGEMPMFVKIVESFTYAASDNFSAVASAFSSGLSTTEPGRCQFRVLPDQRDGLAALAV